ncbi:hypothetical protein O4H61_09905 [Roseovarius aestuarii]|nr:hypothetical protein [Roseovarius aestuarii]
MQTQAGAGLVGVLCVFAFTANAQNDVILRVSGQISGGTVSLDREAISALPSVQIITTTSVTDGKHSFTGFLMRDLLDRLDAEGETVTAIAVNDYVVDIPMADFYDYDVIVADSMDGVALSRADKGPLWIIYPRDEHEVLQDIRYDYRWVWQLSQLEVR